MCRSSSSTPPLPSSPKECKHHNIHTPFIQKALPKQQPEFPTLSPQPHDDQTLQPSIQEARLTLSLALPMILTGLLFYSRSMISMLFLGRLGPLPLAGGALAIGFANITGYSVLSGLAMGMEPICGQAFGAKKINILGLALQRSVLLLIIISIPISLLWLNMSRILLLCGQDELISAAAQSYILFSIPDLICQSFIHPLRIYLRSQSINMPLTYCAAAAILLHLPITYLLVIILNLGIKGVALAGVCTNFNLVLSLLSYIYFSGLHESTGVLNLSLECFKEWKPLLGLAIPSCVSVCLEWWWYELMIMLCGLLLDPRSTVASMGILIQTTSLIYIFPSSLSFGVSTRVSNELGANQPDKAKRAATVGLSCSVVLGLIAFAFAFSVRNVWSWMFTDDEGIAMVTASVLPVLGLCELGNCPQTTGCGVLRGSARPKAGANINLGAFYMVGMPVAVGFAFWGGLDFKGLWLGLMAAQATCVVLMLWVVLRTDWVFQAERAQKLMTGVDEVVVVDDDDEEKALQGIAVDDHVDDENPLLL
ncbi:putative multi antimicrobial extrusion protein [Dioscorea sansibarensis]